MFVLIITYFILFLNYLYIRQAVEATSGNGPCARFGHSGIAIGEMLWVIGGGYGSDIVRDGDDFYDVYVLNTSSMKWECVCKSKAEEDVEEQEDEEVDVDEDDPDYVDEGAGNSENQEEEDSDTRNEAKPETEAPAKQQQTREKKKTEKPEKQKKIIKEEVVEEEEKETTSSSCADVEPSPLIMSPPAPKAVGRCHSSCLIGRKILFFGGSISFSNDICVFDTETRRWCETTRVVGTLLPRRRMSHSMSFYNGFAFVWGGFSRRYGNLGDLWILQPVLPLDDEAKFAEEVKEASAEEAEGTDENDDYDDMPRRGRRVVVLDPDRCLVS